MINSRKYLQCLVFLISALELMVNIPAAQANCSDKITKLELVEPAMERLWQKLNQENSYPWGKWRPYGEIVDNRIILTADFDRLTGSQKQQVLNMLHLDYNDNWFNLLTPQEQAAALKDPGIGALSPYQVYASDGRVISVPYDGCTRMTLLTEKARFSWYFHQLDRNNGAEITPEMLRNAGNPSWRQVRFSIAAQEEVLVRQKFWQAIGYEQAHEGWWIAWVPEQGHFEINVPTNYDQNRLQRYWQVASRQYRYVIIANDGTFLDLVNLYL